MTKFDLFDSIGNVDDELIEKAKQPKKSSKKAFLAIISVAACTVFACTSVLIVQSTNKNNNVVVDSGVSSAVGTNSVKPVDEKSPENGVTGGTSSEALILDDSYEKALEEMPFEIYYVIDGKMKQKTIVTYAYPENLFDTWKKENQIGDEVCFISVQISDNDTTEISEYSGAEVATHRVGDYTVYTLTITKSIEQYYDSIGKELLLDSLEKTMTGMCNPIPDEYQLILSDNTENEKSESNDVVNSAAYSEAETNPTNPGTEESDEYVTQEYTPNESETTQPSSNYAEESESNHVAPEDIQYNDQGEILE